MELPSVGAVDNGAVVGGGDADQLGIRPVAAEGVHSRTAFRITVRELKQLVQLYMQVDFPGRRSSTIVRQADQLKAFIKWMAEHGRCVISYETLSRYVNQMSKEMSYSTLKLRMVSINRFLTWLERTGRIIRSPHHGLRMPINREQKAPPVFTQEEYVKLRQVAAGHWIEWLVILGWHTGMSISDACTLRWANVDMNLCCLKINRIKTGTPAIVPFDPSDDLGRAIRKLADQNPNPNPEDFVCPDAADKMRATTAIHQLASMHFRVLTKKAGIHGKGYHAFRHAFISSLANGNINIGLATKITGHKKPDMFARYIHPDVNQLRKHMSEARAATVGAKEVYVEPDGTTHRTGNSFLWRPNGVWVVKRGRVKLPDGTRIGFVKSGDDASGKMAIVQPCNAFGEITHDMRLVVDVRDVAFYR